VIFSHLQRWVHETGAEFYIHIMGYRRSGEARMVVLGQRLEEPGLLPGFSVGVEEIFAGVEGMVRS